MRSIYRMLGPTSLAVLDVCRYESPNPNEYIITRINVPEKYRRDGVGNDLLRECCETADKEGIDLYVEVASYGEMTNEQLASWYRTFGFAPVAGSFYLKREAWKKNNA